MLEDEGVLDVVSIGEYRLGFVPLDTDILSLEMDDLYYEVTVILSSSPHVASFSSSSQYSINGDSSPLSVVVKSLQKIQSLFGNIPEIKSKGLASKKVLTISLLNTHTLDLFLSVSVSLSLCLLTSDLTKTHSISPTRGGQLTSSDR
jgi:hypothetical protein